MKNLTFVAILSLITLSVSASVLVPGQVAALAGRSGTLIEKQLDTGDQKGTCDLGIEENTVVMNIRGTEFSEKYQGQTKFEINTNDVLSINNGVTSVSQTVAKDKKLLCNDFQIAKEVRRVMSFKGRTVTFETTYRCSVLGISGGKNMLSFACTFP